MSVERDAIPTTTLHEELAGAVGPELTKALTGRGFERLTPVQRAMLDPALTGRDLRISSQTGSGKTVAIGLALRHDVGAEGTRALVVTPTRELAKQVAEELGWLYASLGVKVASVTGGTGYRDELRALREHPGVVVGTPGRLLDHLTRGRIDVSGVAAAVLDEADRMLDMGFRDEVEGILEKLPDGVRTHLVSATFPHEVRALADGFQTNPVRVEGTPLGSANADIDHVIHLVHPRERLAAIVNLLLASPGAQTLVFARTRADVADLATALEDAGFTVGMLSGEMEQPERNRALAAFKRGALAALVATDVAARGIDVVDIARVIHAEPPSDADGYIHRSGRTGRAGKKGTSSLLVSPPEHAKVSRLLGRARVNFRVEPIPTADAIRDARDESLLAMLTADGEDAVAVDDRCQALAERVTQAADLSRAIARLVALAQSRGTPEPRDVTPIAARPSAPEKARRPERRQDGRQDEGRRPQAGWVAFRVSWGRVHGADPRRLLAMLCRRGDIDGRAIGAIRVGPTHSIVEIASPAVAAFEERIRREKLDGETRDRRATIRRWREDGPSPAARPTKKRRPGA